MNSDGKNIILGRLEESIDDVLQEHGFVRRQNSLIYSKKIGNTKQKIEMFFNSYYASFMLINPFCSVSFPKINEIARAMTENDPIFSSVINGMKNETLHQPIQFFSKSERWVVEYGQERDELAPQIGTFLKQYTIPLLMELECEDDFIKLYENQDKRIMWGDVQHIYVASAYVLRNDYAKGLDVLERRFKKLGHRLHATVFRYMQNLLKVNS